MPIDVAPRLPTVIVLASGRGERFRAAGGVGSKLKALLAGRTVLEHTLAAVRASGLDWRLEDAGHPGMGDSIAAAVRATAGAAGWLILPGDLPLVQASTLRAVADALGQGAQVVQPSYRGERGHPVGFSAAFGPQLAALSGPKGAAPILRELRDTVGTGDTGGKAAIVALDIDDIGIVTDIDTPDALARAEAILRGLSAG